MTRLQSIFVFLIAMITLGSACAGEKVDRAIDVSTSGSLYIDNTRGRLKVVGWDKPQILLQGELDDSARKLIFKRKGKKAYIKVMMKGMSHRGHGSDLKIFVPRDTALRFKGVDTAYFVSNMNAKIEGQTINGDLDVTNVHAKIKISSVSGKVKISESSGMARIESVSGKVSFSGNFKDARIKSMTGNIMANIDKIDRLRIENVSGDTAVSGYLRSKAKVELSSVSGDIHYKSVGEFNANCKIASQFGGKITNELTDDEAWGELLEQKKLSFVSGDGSGKLVMNTVSGTVTLDK